MALNRQYFAFWHCCGVIYMYCVLDTNECDNSPCGPNGDCLNTQGSFTCNCQPGYEGQLCDTGKYLLSTLTL